MIPSFNKLIVHDRRADIVSAYYADNFFARNPEYLVIFMSHKTGDTQAEREARRISEKHEVEVYMAEWDKSIEGDSKELPEHIMKAIRSCRAFLVHVVSAIANSMWIGYELGGAHAMQKQRAKITYQKVCDLPSVVEALESLDDTYAVDQWIRENLNEFQH